MHIVAPVVAKFQCNIVPGLLRGLLSVDLTAAILIQDAVWIMAIWILATATAFSDVQSVRMPLASMRTQHLPALQPAEQRWQPAVVSLQSSTPIFLVRGAVRSRHVAEKARTASAATWLGLGALLFAALITRVRRKPSEFSGSIVPPQATALRSISSPSQALFPRPRVSRCTHLMEGTQYTRFTRSSEIRAKVVADEPIDRPNVRALATTLALSVAWTIAQLIGALASNSSALLSDALAMTVDGGAYAFNLFSELRPESERRIKIAAPAVSAVLLLVVTALSFGDALTTLNGGGEASSGEGVDGALVLGFGSAMLLVDMAMLYAILFRGEANAGSVWTPCPVSPREQLNLFSGLSHVVADTLRSVTQVIVGVLILTGGPSEAVDAYGTLAISSTILVGALFMLWEVGVQWREGVGVAD